MLQIRSEVELVVTVSYFVVVSHAVRSAQRRSSCAVRPAMYWLSSHTVSAVQTRFDAFVGSADSYCVDESHSVRAWHLVCEVDVADTDSNSLFNCCWMFVVHCRCCSRALSVPFSYTVSAVLAHCQCSSRTLSQCRSCWGKFAVHWLGSSRLTYWLIVCQQKLRLDGITNPIRVWRWRRALDCCWMLAS